jgi:hypothetical protein
VLANPEYFLLPCLLAFVGFIFRALSRHQSTPSDLVQDLAMGPELMLSALVLAATRALRLLRQPSPPQLWGVDAGLACLALSVGLAVMLLTFGVIIRYWGCGFRKF